MIASISINSSLTSPYAIAKHRPFLVQQTVNAHEHHIVFSNLVVMIVLGVFVYLVHEQLVEGLGKNRGMDLEGRGSEKG